MQFIYEPEFWVAVSFFIFIGVLVYFGVHMKVVSALDARALLISKELEEARRLREEAEKRARRLPAQAWRCSHGGGQHHRTSHHGSKDPCCGDTPVAQGIFRPAVLASLSFSRA